MKELKFLKVLKLMPKNEILRFEDFLNSPYCNQNENLIEFYNTFKVSDFNSTLDGEQKSRAWALIAPGIEFNDSKWRKACFEFTGLIYKFFSFQKLKEKKLLENNLLLEYIIDNNIHIPVNSLLESTKNLFKTSKISSDFHLHLFNFNQNEYDLLNFEVEMEKASNIEEVHHHLDLFYLSEKVKQLVNVLTRRNDFNIPIKINFEEESLHLIKKYNIDLYPEINIYFILYNLKKNNISSDYKKFKAEVEKHLYKFELDEAADIFKEAINYCIAQVNEGYTDFNMETLAWYKFGLANDVVFLKNKFHPGHFLNIVLFGIRTKEFSWTENFIEEYQKIIPKESKKDIVTFSLARLYFNQNKFEDVIEKLRDVEFNELTYNLDAKVLLLATYYEVDEISAMISLADSYRTFLNRHEKDITKAKQLRYLNFIKFIKKLSRVKYQDKKSKEKLIEDIQSTDGVVNKAWLTEKAKGL